MICLLSLGAVYSANENVRQVKADWKTTTYDGGKKSKKTAASGNGLIKPSTKYLRDLRQKQLRELQQLREIHEYQTELFQQNARKQPAAVGQSKKKDPDFRIRIRRNAMALESTLAELKDFPFAFNISSVK